MTQADIDHIQRTLRITLPPDYVQTLLTHGEFSGDQEHHFDLDSLSLLIRNQELRTEGYFGMSWPNSFYWIGSGWGGEAFLIKLNVAGSAVYTWDWNVVQSDGEVPEVEEIADSIYAFVEDLDNMPNE